jgi:hypothetical protein
MYNLHQYKIIINIIHILIQGSLLVYIGKKKNETPTFIYYIIGILALLIPFNIHKPTISTSRLNLINIVHYIIVMPLFLYIAYKQKFTIETYDNIFILGIIIIVYQLSKVVKRLKLIKI